MQVVFVIGYHSTQKGGDRLGFVSLLRHATTFIKDLHKYKDSVALVVSKVRFTNVGTMRTCEFYWFELALLLELSPSL